MPYGGPSNAASLNSIENAVINGDASISQVSPVNTNTPVNLTAAVPAQYNNCDNFGLNFPAFLFNSAIVDDSQRADHPILGAQGFSKSIAVTTAEAAIAAGEFCNVFNSIEGFLFQPFFQQTAILTYWAKSPKAGVHCGSLSNEVDRSYVWEYVIAAANTWQQFAIGVTFNYVGGTFNYTTGLGMRLNFPLAAGATFQTTPNGWRNGVFYATVNQQNLLDTVGNTFRVTDVNLQVGIFSTAFIRQPFDIALGRAQRYFYTSFPYGTAPANGAAAANPISIIADRTWSPDLFAANSPQNGSGVVAFPTPMRILNPTFNGYSVTAGQTGVFDASSALPADPIVANNYSLNGIAVSSLSVDSCIVTYDVPRNTKQGDFMQFHLTANARL